MRTHRGRNWALGALALAGPAVRADQTLFNQSSMAVYLRVHDVRISKALFKVQVHRTGKTPKTDTITLVLDEPKDVERKVFLPQPALLPLVAQELTLASQSRVEGTSMIHLMPGESARFFKPELKLPAGDRNHVVFSVCTLECVEGYPAFREERLRVCYGFEQDRFGALATEILYGSRVPAEAEDAGESKRQVDFREKRQEEDDLVLVDPPREGCGSCILQ